MGSHPRGSQIKFERWSVSDPSETGEKLSVGSASDQAKRAKRRNGRKGEKMKIEIPIHWLLELGAVERKIERAQQLSKETCDGKPYQRICYEEKDAIVQRTVLALKIARHVRAQYVATVTRLSGFPLPTELTGEDLDKEHVREETAQRVSTVEVPG